MRGDHVVVREVDEGRGVVDQRVGDGAASVEVHGRPFDPLREGFRYPLLLDRDTADPVGEPVHVQRTAPDLREHALGDAPVVLDEVALGDPVGGEHDLVRIGDGDLVAVNNRHCFSDLSR